MIRLILVVRGMGLGMTDSPKAESRSARIDKLTSGYAAGKVSKQEWERQRQDILDKHGVALMDTHDPNDNFIMRPGNLGKVGNPGGVLRAPSEQPPAKTGPSMNEMYPVPPDQPPPRCR